MLAVSKVQRVYLIGSVRLIRVRLHHRGPLAVVYRSLQHHVARTLHPERHLHVGVLPHVIHRANVIAASERQVKHAVRHRACRGCQCVLAHNGYLDDGLALAKIVVYTHAHLGAVGILRAHLLLHASADEGVRHVHTLHRRSTVLVCDVECVFYVVTL